MLGTLPARKALSDEVEDAAYGIVMEGMTAHGLEEAVRAALRGEHGSTFFPSPPELRALHDKAMEHHVSMRNLIARQEQITRERPRDIPPRTPEEIARHEDRMAQLYKNMGWGEGDNIAQERVRLDPELLAQIPDAPTTWRKAVA